MAEEGSTGSTPTGREPTPDGGKILERDIDVRHLSVPRHLRYAVRGNEGDPSEVWFVLHGYGQLAHRFLRYFDAIDDGRRLLVAPEGLHRHYLSGAGRKVGASWMTSEDRLTDIDDYVVWLERLYARVLSGVGNEGVPVVTLGFSQGVHSLARWLALGEARLDIAALWGSPIPPDLDLGAHTDRLRSARLVLVSGDEDPHFGPDAAAAAGERLRSHRIPFQMLRFAGGHRIDRAVLTRLAEAVGGES